MHIKELILKTKSLHRTRLFYHKTLELDILKETEEAISFKAGNTILTFQETDDGKPFYHFAFNIVNNKFSDSFEWINNKLDILPAEDGIMIAGYNDWNAQSFYFYDNNGSILEFIVRFDLPYHSDKPFSSECITEISEIGIVTSDVQHKAEQLNEQFGIPYFQYGPRLHDFIAMGDNYGLILLSQTKRPWVPTNKVGQSFPVTVVTDDGKTITSA
jgi:catechol-2,3-dioxygenase